MVDLNDFARSIWVESPVKCLDCLHCFLNLCDDVLLMLMLFLADISFYIPSSKGLSQRVTRMEKFLTSMDVFVKNCLICVC